MVAAGCVSRPIPAERRDQVSTAQDGLTGKYGWQRMQRMNNVKAVKRR